MWCIITIAIVTITIIAAMRLLIKVIDSYGSAVGSAFALATIILCTLMGIFMAKEALL